MAKNKTTDPTQVKLTDEIRALLHGFAMVSTNVTVPYKVVLEGVPEAFLPTFKVNTLTVSEKEELKVKQFNDDNEEYFSELIRSHIVGWDNLYDISTSTIVDFKKDIDNGCDKEMYKLLPNKIKIDLLTYISTMSGR